MCLPPGPLLATAKRLHQLLHEAGMLLLLRLTSLVALKIGSSGTLATLDLR